MALTTSESITLMVNGTCAVGVAHQVLADAVHVLGDHRIVDQLDLRFDLLRVLPAAGYLAFDGVPVADAAPASHVAVADGVDVGLAAVVLDVAVVLGRQRGGACLGAFCTSPALGCPASGSVRSLRLRADSGPGSVAQRPGYYAERRQSHRDCQPSEFHGYSLRLIIRPVERHQAP